MQELAGWNLANAVTGFATAIFVVERGLATGRNQTVHATVVAYHALWHRVGAFGFASLSVYNQLRLTSAPR